MVVAEPAPVTQCAPPNSLSPALLIVADPTKLNIAREALIELELGWDVVFATNTKEAHALVAGRDVDVVLVDLGTPTLDGIDLVESLVQKHPFLPIVLMSAPFAVRVALDAMRKGAADHFPRDLLNSEPGAVLETLRAAARDHQRRKTSVACLNNMYFEFSLDSDRGLVPAIVRRMVDGILEVRLCDRAGATRVGVALEECLLNAIIHGNLEVSSELRQDDEARYYRQIEERRRQAPYCERQVKVTARIGRDEAVFVVQDDGPGFDVERLPDPTDPENLFRIGGRGILLMRAFMTAVHFNERGNRVTLVKRR